ncbi:MAG: SGNH/GDSL hydrolase family protein [Clostridia bacterium]|jgi:lysophospholipase L1-like esterase
MRKFIFLLILLFPLNGWAYQYFHRGIEPETVNYCTIVGGQNQFTLNEINKSIKYNNGTVTLAGFTGNLSTVNGTAFITNPSVDLRKYQGFKITLTDSQPKTIVGKIMAAGTGETYGGDLFDATKGTFEGSGAGTTGSWIVYGNNTIEAEDQGGGDYALKITYVDNASGAYVLLADAADLSADLTVGALYKLTMKAKVTGNVWLNLAYGNLNSTITLTNTSFATQTFYFTANSTNSIRLRLAYFSTGEVCWIDNLALKKVLTPSANGGVTIVTNSDTVQSWYSNSGVNANSTSYTGTVGGFFLTSFMAIGDSKTAGDVWVGNLASALNYYSADVGVAGTTVANWASSIGGVLLPPQTVQSVVLINLGVNDWSDPLPTEETWKANYQTIIDAVHAKWPLAKIYLTKPWKRDHDDDALTFAGYIDELIASNSGVCFVGDNEYTWLRGADDGTTMTIDGTHYSAAGEIEKVNQMKAVLQ